MAAPALPDGWQWQLDNASQRWGFLHVDTKHKQYFFPHVGDEIAYQNSAAIQPPAPQITHAKTVATLNGTVASASTVTLSQTTASDDLDIAHITAETASITIATATATSLASTPSVKRKPIARKQVGSPTSPTPAAASPVTAESTAEAVQPPSSSTKQATSPTGAENLPTSAPYANQPAGQSPAEAAPTLPSPSIPTPVLQSPQNGAPMLSSPMMSSPVFGNSPYAFAVQAQGHPMVPSQMSMMFPAYPPILQPIAEAQHMPALTQVQTAPVSQSVPQQLQQQQRPGLPTTTSAPQVLQTDNIFQTDMIAAPPRKQSVTKRMSRSFGTFAEKNPKMLASAAIGGAVVAQAAGLLVGMDAMKDAAWIQRNVEKHKAKKAARLKVSAAQSQQIPGQAQTHPQMPQANGNNSQPHTFRTPASPTMGSQQAQQAIHGITSAAHHINQAYQQNNGQTSDQQQQLMAAQMQAYYQQQQQQLAAYQQAAGQQQAAFQQQLAGQQQMYNQVLAQQQSQQSTLQSQYLQPTFSPLLPYAQPGYLPAQQQPIYVDNSASSMGSGGEMDALMYASLTSGQGGTVDPTAVTGSPDQTDPTSPQMSATVDTDPNAAVDQSSLVDPAAMTDSAGMADPAALTAPTILPDPASLINPAIGSAALADPGLVDPSSINYMDSSTWDSVDDCAGDDVF